MKKLLGFIGVLILSYWMIRPLLSTGYFPMHDDTQVARVVEMGRALREGQFPVRWVGDLGYGYGYPIFNFYGPLPYYVGGLFYALGFSGLVATKMMMALGLIAAGITMYIAVTDLVGISGGVLAAALYMYAPYHAVDAYVRGAVGEYWALIFLPLIFWGFKRRNFLIGAAGVAGLILSHTILGYAGLVFVALAYAVSGMRKEALLSILLGLGLSAFFWFPALTEMRYTNVASQVSATSDYHDHFVCIGQLWNSVWGYGGSAKGCLDGFAFKIGKLHLILGLIALLGVFMKRRYVVIAGLAVFLLSVFFMLPVSRPVWETLPLFAYVQYPWRFLAFAIFGISLMGAGITVLISNRYLRWAAVFVSIGVLLFIEAKHFTPQYIYDRNPSDFETAEDLRWRVSKISDEYLPGAVTRPTESSQYIRDTIPGSDGYTVQTVENRNTYKKFEFRSGWDNEVTVNVADFPGWRYMVNEFTVRPQLSNGLPRLTVPSGLTVVQMWFTDTPVRTAGNIVSLASVAVCLYIYDRKNKKNIS
jgi:hypothetical protein